MWLVGGAQRFVSHSRKVDPGPKKTLEPRGACGREITFFGWCFCRRSEKLCDSVDFAGLLLRLSFSKLVEGSDCRL